MNNNSVFTKKYIINNDSINEEDIIEVIFINKNLAKASGISTTVESFNKYFIITTKFNPIEDLDIIIFIKMQK